VHQLLRCVAGRGYKSKSILVVDVVLISVAKPVSFILIMILFTTDGFPSNSKSIFSFQYDQSLNIKLNVLVAVL
jgi:hypothetical protein